MQVMGQMVMMGAIRRDHPARVVVVVVVVVKMVEVADGGIQSKHRCPLRPYECSRYRWEIVAKGPSGRKRLPFPSSSPSYRAFTPPLDS